MRFRLGVEWADIVSERCDQVLNGNVRKRLQRWCTNKSRREEGYSVHAIAILSRVKPSESLKPAQTATGPREVDSLSRSPVGPSTSGCSDQPIGVALARVDDLIVIVAPTILPNFGSLIVLHPPNNLLIGRRTRLLIVKISFFLISSDYGIPTHWFREIDLVVIYRLTSVSS